MEEENKIIAEFMGMTLVEDLDQSNHYEWLPRFKHSNWCFKYAPPFNESWDWLMPVCYKLKTLETPESVDNDKNNKAIMKAWENIAYSVACINIEMVYDAVVSNIKLYNKIMS